MAQLYNNNEEIDSVSYDDTHNVPCDGCQSTQIYSDRYKCLKCTDYNLCGNCFEERRQTKGHLCGHAMVHFKLPNELFGQSILHSRQITLKHINELFAGKQHGIECNGCKQAIVGVRFKCDICHNYNLCSKCMEQHITSKNHQNNHPLVVTSNQNLIKIDIADIRKGNILGQGAFGQVCKATWLSKKRIIACKVILVTPQRSHLEESFRKELAAYAELSGAYILKTFGYGEHMIGNGIKECYLITEFMHRGSLANVICDRNEKISLRRKLSMACHIVSGMRKLHAHCMIHRDIRPDNILVSKNYTAKIGDMGIAHVFNPAEKHTLIGCMPFMPPEFHRGNGQYDQSLDVFTYGLTLNELFTEKAHQFNKSNKRVKLIEQSSIFADLITQCINHESIRRPTAAELEDILHRFRRASDVYIQEKHSNYASQTLTTKNNILIKFFNEYQKQDGVVEPKPVYLPPPKPQMDPALMNQHFDDMMKQFNNVHRVDFRRGKDRQRSPNFNKWMKYFDDDQGPIFEAEAVRIDRRPPPPLARSSTPPPNFLRVQDDNHQQFLNVVKNRRPRTPTPLPPAFGDLEHHRLRSPFADPFRLVGMNNDIEQRLGRFNFDAEFDQHDVRVHCMMQQFK